MECAELYKQYLHALEIQARVIERYRRRRKAEIDKGNFRAVIELNRALIILYDEQSELEQSAAELKCYACAKRA